jgi:F-type H+-transporting ATPase subunit epsilon
VTLRVSLVVPDRELWSGTASIVIAKTAEGDIGVLTGHSPVFGVLAEGSLVEIVPEEGSDQARVKAAVSGGFLSVADNQVSILATEARLGAEVDAERARRDIEQTDVAGVEEPAEVKYARAQLRAAGQA